MKVEEDVRRFRDWYHRYIEGQLARNPAMKPAMMLKKAHTRRVCDNTRRITKQLGLSRDDRILAEIIGLFHDVGRYRQYAATGEYTDNRSLDHGDLGARILKEAGVLNHWPAADREVVYEAVVRHNKKTVPPGKPSRQMLFIRILRDADKLDVWNVMTRHYRDPDPRHTGMLELGLKDTPGLSPEVEDDILRGRLVDISHVRNLNDFKVLQMGWVFDLNFSVTCRMARKGKYLEQLRSVLPGEPVFRRMYRQVSARLADCAGSPEKPPYGFSRYR